MKLGTKLKDNKGTKVTEPDFPGKIWFAQKWGKCAPNAPKMDPFAIYSKCCKSVGPFNVFLLFYY